MPTVTPTMSFHVSLLLLDGVDPTSCGGSAGTLVLADGSAIAPALAGKSRPDGPGREGAAAGTSLT